MNTTSFKKACKRYADAHALPLSTAQEAFSGFLGFNNFDAAIKSFAKFVKIKSANQDNFYWSEFSRAEFKLTIHMLSQKFVRDNKSSDAVNWESKSSETLRAVLHSMEHIGQYPKSAGTLRNHLTPEFVMQCYSSTDPHLSTHHNSLGRFAQTALHLYTGKHGLTGTSLAYFNGRVAAVEQSTLRYLDLLESAEGRSFLKGLLRPIIAEQRLNTEDELKLFSDKLTLMEMYSEQEETAPLQ